MSKQKQGINEIVHSLCKNTHLFLEKPSLSNNCCCRRHRCVFFFIVHENVNCAMKWDLPLKRVARADNTDANFPTKSLVLRSSWFRDELANLSSVLFEQHVPDARLSQYTRRTSVEIKRKTNQFNHYVKIEMRKMVRNWMKEYFLSNWHKKGVALQWIDGKSISAW